MDHSILDPQNFRHFSDTLIRYSHVAHIRPGGTERKVGAAGKEAPITLHYIQGIATRRSMR
jgi:hypothetical protein